MEYSEDQVSNFVVQSLLRSISKRIRHCLDVEDDATLKSLKRLNKVGKSIYKELTPCITKLLSSHRVGVVWHLAALAVLLDSIAKTKNKSQKSATSVAEAVLSGANQILENKEADDSERAVSQSQGAAAVRSLILGSAGPSKGGAGAKQWLNLNVPGVRLVTVLLKSAASVPSDAHLPATDSRLSLARGITVGLGEDTLVKLCCDNTGSRSLVEALLLDEADNPHPHESWTNMRGDLISRLRPHWAHLGGHPVGRHVLRHAFSSADVIAKESIASALVQSLKALQGSTAGRQSIKVTSLVRFQNNRAMWVAETKQQRDSFIKTSKFLSDLMPEEDRANHKEGEHEGRANQRREKNSVSVDSSRRKSKRPTSSGDSDRTVQRRLQSQFGFGVGMSKGTLLSAVNDLERKRKRAKQ